jgi:hypothetical protein
VFGVIMAGYGFFRFEPILNDSKTSLSQLSILISESNYFFKEQKPEWID